MVSIIRFDNSCKIVDEDDVEIYKALDKELSFQIKGAEFSAAYQGYINESGEFVAWDGRRHLLQSSGKFPIGLLPRVQEFFAQRGIYAPVIDQRTSRNPLLELDISSNLQKLGKIPRPYQIMAAETAVGTDRGIIRMATGSGKCNSIDSLHLTEHGLLDYKELLESVSLPEGCSVPYNSTVATSNSFGKTETSSMIYRDGYGHSRKIITNSGYNLTATNDHKIQIMSKSGIIEWKAFKDLTTDDFAIINYGNNFFGKNEISLDEAYWYGLLLGDGSLTLPNRIELINKDKHIIDFVKTFCNKNNLNLLIRTRDGTDAVYLRIFSKKYRDELFNFGFEYVKAPEKSIPKNLRMLSKKSLAMVMRGLFETDGWANLKNKSIGIGSTSLKMINQIHLILLNFGIISKIYIKPDNRKSTYKTYYTIRISTSFVDLFNKQIGFDPLGYKFKISEKIHGLSKKDHVPYQNHIISDILEKGILKYGSITNFILGSKLSKYDIYKLKHKNVQRTDLIELFNLSKNKLGKSQEDFNNLYCDKIKYILETESDNYDFVIPKTHSFISQGFVNHNTLVSALITSKIGKKALILVIGKDLLYQTHNFFTKVFGQEIGIIGDGKCEIQDINVATIWSVGKALGIKSNSSLDDCNDSEKNIDSSKFKNIKQMLLDSELVLIDECHLSACDTVQAIARNIKGEYVYGMSASPWRDDGADMLIEAFLGRKIVDISARTLIDQGYLVEPSIRFLAPKPYKFKSGKYQTIYSKYVVENEQRNGMVIKGTQKLVEQGFVPLVLFHTIKHGDILFKELKKSIPTALLSGKDTSNVREKIKAELEDGKLKCLIASKIFDIGIDVPILSGLVIAGAGKSSVRALQRIGRVIRPYPGKKMSAVLEFYDQAPYLSQHAEIRKNIYESEFNVQIPKMKNE